MNFDGGKVRLDNSGGAAVSTDSFNDGEWHHLVTVKSTNANLGGVIHYVDGSLIPDGGSGGSTFNIPDSQNFTIGGDRTGAGRINFIGTIDDFRLYSSALDASAVTSLYASGLGEGYYTPTIPNISVNDYVNASPVPVSVTFKEVLQIHPLVDSHPATLTVNGGSVSNFSSSGGGGHTYTFDVTPTIFPSTVNITIPKRCCSWRWWRIQK